MFVNIVLQFDCCGINDGDYKLYFKMPNESFPQSCCKLEDKKKCPITNRDASNVTDTAKTFKTKVRKILDTNSPL